MSFKIFLVFFSIMVGLGAKTRDDCKGSSSESDSYCISNTGLASESHQPITPRLTSDALLSISISDPNLSQNTTGFSETPVGQGVLI